MIFSIQCKSVSEAVDILSTARRHTVAGSYHPAGGTAPKRYIPITHTVYLDCTPEMGEKIVQEVNHDRFQTYLTARAQAILEA